jgi:CheY-like chemotaxis protein
MSLTGPIILIEDDANDLDVLVNALRENNVKNATKCFTDAKEALAYLMATNDQPFLILCDIRLQGMNGLEFRSAINQNDFLRNKAIPFLFYTAAVSQAIINEAYDLTVQGFFEKPASFDALKEQMHDIVSYWTKCIHPNSSMLNH